MINTENTAPYFTTGAFLPVFTLLVLDNLYYFYLHIRQWSESHEATQQA
jgi:hypothetical protein